MNLVAHRFNALDGMRGVAALTVMTYHLTQHTSQSLFSGAAVTVDLFFCLSGFVVAYAYLERLQQSMSIGEFVMRRLVRLYPMFLCGLALGSIALLVKVALGQTSLGYSQASIAILANTLYLPYLSNFSSYVQIGGDRVLAAIFPTNIPSWSLFFELVSNLIFAGVAFRAAKGRFLIPCLIGMSGLILWTAMYDFPNPGWSTYNVIGGLPRVMFSFFSGALAYLVFRKFKASIPVVRPAFLMAFLLAISLTHWSTGVWLAETLIVVPTIVLLGAVSIPGSAAAARGNQYLGWISYPAYCLHFPIYSLFTSATNNADYGILALLICAPITLLLSHLVAKHVEEPMRALLSAKLFARREAVSLAST